MCIIVYKPKNIKLPSRKILHECFENNPDGAGFMYCEKQKVHIEKGFTDFDKFYKTVKALPKDSALVMHFRISTQGGVKPSLTHPYPLSTDYADMRKLKTTTDVGIAHNGIISLTSASYFDRNKIDYNDTMTFIKEYASLIITEPTYYKDQNKVALLAKLAGSKLAIMSKDQNVTLIGEFIEDGGCFYSNSTYKPYCYTYISNTGYTDKYADCIYNYKTDTKTTGKSTDLDSDKYLPENYYSDYDTYDGYMFDDWADAYWNNGGFEFNSDTGACPNVCDKRKYPDYCLNCKYYGKCKSKYKSKYKTDK